MEQPVHGDPNEQDHISEVEEELIRRFTSKPRRIPKRPPYSRISLLIIRKEWLPFFYALYDHDLHRFVELQYRHTANGPMRSVQIPPDRQPPGPVPKTG
jgi:hypothetical protein